MRPTELVFNAPNGDRYVMQTDCEPVRFTLGPDTEEQAKFHTIPCFGYGFHPMAMVAAAAAGDEDACHVPERDGRQYVAANGILAQVPAPEEPATIAERITVVLKEGQRLMTRDDIYKALQARFPQWWSTANKGSVSGTLTVNAAFKNVATPSSVQMFSL